MHHITKMKILKTHRYELFFMLYVAWIMTGVFPLTCYESDSMHLIAGCDMMVQQGWQFPPSYSYGYDMQPLVTHLIVGMKLLMPPLTCEEIYCLLTALAAIGLAIVTVELVHKLTAIRREWILSGMFLIPESAAIAMYPNSAVFASLFMVFGLWMTVRGRAYWGALLLAIAPLFRIDILIVYPVYSCILWWMGYRWKEILGHSLKMAAWIAIFILAGFSLLGANPMKSLFAYNSFNETLDYSPLVIYAVVAFYTVVGAALAFFGLILLGRQKRMALLSIFVIPIVLLHVMFRHTGCAAKHYLYLIPFALIAIVPALKELFFISTVRMRWWLGGGLFLFLTMSLRICLPQYEWIERQGAVGQAGPLWILYQEKETPYHASIGIGTGQIIPTADEYMLASGNLFYPSYIHRFKQTLAERTEKLENFLANKKDYDLLVFSWQDEYHYTTRLANAGYRIHREKGTGHKGQFITHYTKGDERITLYFEQIGEKETARLRESITRHAESGKETFIVVSRCDRTDSGMGALCQDGLIEEVIDRLYKIKTGI